MNRQDRRRANRLAFKKDIHGVETISQVVLSASGKVLVGTYTTKSGQVKNRYKSNPEAYPIKTIYHKAKVLN